MATTLFSHSPPCGLMFYRTLMFCSLLTLAFGSHAQQVVRTMPVSSDIDKYTLKILELALARVNTSYKVQVDLDQTRTQARFIADVKAGNVELMWAATDEHFESELLPVRIPLLKGLLGHRIFLIHKNDQYKFDKVNTLDDLRQLKLGQGATWADTQILESNRLNVVKANKYESLLYMLDGGRFDAFPRGIQEPWSEVNKIPGLELAVEKRVMLVYKMPFYFFVGRDNRKLARDLEDGLNSIIADGTFDKVFFADPSIRNAVELADLKNRIVFYLDNPNLPPETPVNRPELWLDVKTLE